MRTNRVGARLQEDALRRFRVAEAESVEVDRGPDAAGCTVAIR